MKGRYTMRTAYDIEVYDKCKYNAESKVIHEAHYNDVAKWEVKTILPEELDFDEYDEFNEYLVLTFTDGETATFRNSHVDMFRSYVR